MTIGIRFSARSDVGLVRANNQDSAFAGEQLLVVSDGMGGHAGGEVASALCVASMAPLNNEKFTTSDMLERLGDAIERARIDLVQRARAHSSLAGMGTTVTSLLLCENKLAMAHMGDSRGYLLRDGKLTQVTKDHTFVQHLVDTGKITAEEAETHPQRSVVMRVLGDFELDLIPDLSIREARPGDRWLLCSDGLSGFVRFETMEQTLRDVADLELCCEYLIQLALRGGGSDNITCVIADVVELDDDATRQVPVAGAPGNRKQQVALSVGSVALGADVPVVVGQTATLSDSTKLLVDAHERVNAVIATAIARKEGLADPEPEPATGSLSLGPAAVAALTHTESADKNAKDAAGNRTTAAPINDDDDELIAQANDPAPKRKVLRTLINSVLTLLLIGGIGYGGYYWGSQQYFLGVHNGKVAIFNGFPQSLGPIHLSSTVLTSELEPSSLKPFEAQQLYNTIRADSLEDAKARLAALETEVAVNNAQLEDTTEPADETTAPIPSADPTTATTDPGEGTTTPATSSESTDTSTGGN